jgi:hypothetical protein
MEDAFVPAATKVEVRFSTETCPHALPLAKSSKPVRSVNNFFIWFV